MSVEYPRIITVTTTIAAIDRALCHNEFVETGSLVKSLAADFCYYYRYSRNILSFPIIEG